MPVSTLLTGILPKRLLTLGLTALAFALHPSSVSLAANPFSVEIIQQFERPGSQPLAAPTRHSNGDLYGTTATGGVSDLGTIYRVSGTSPIETLHSFEPADGINPNLQLVESPSGELWGTAPSGGSLGFGTLFKITTSGTFAKVLDFTGPSGDSPGSVPSALTLHPDGFFYGATEAGGAHGHGTLFRVSDQGILTTLVDFTGNSGSFLGASPAGPIAIEGNVLFGATHSGGNEGFGTLFTFSTSGTFQSLLSFTGAAGTSPGSNPSSGLALHSNGSLYGTTRFGGSSGFGTAFRVQTDGSSFATIHSFDDTTGAKPSGNLVEDATGNLWGCASSGGKFGFGTLFRIELNDSFSVAMDFSGTMPSTLGSTPIGGLSLGPSNLLFGTANAGGPGQRGLVFSYEIDAAFAVVSDFTNELGWNPSGPPSFSDTGSITLPLANGGIHAAGTLIQFSNTLAVTSVTPLEPSVGGLPVGPLLKIGPDHYGVATSQSANARGGIFKLTSDGSLASISPFSSVSGEVSSGPLTLALDGSLFGVAQAGGLANRGVLFQISPDLSLQRILSFTGTAGSSPGDTPLAPLFQSKDGFLYGLTEYGGDNDLGVIFQRSPQGIYTTIASFDATGPHHPSSGFTAAGDGKLYASLRSGGDSGLGALIAFDPTDNSWSTALSFSGTAGDAPGASPLGLLSLGSDGTLYGITEAGGSGSGVAYRFFPANRRFEQIASFGTAEGEIPGLPTAYITPQKRAIAGLVPNADGFLYGTTPTGGTGGGGVLYRIPLLSPLALWKQQTLGNVEAANEGDPDQDGLPNLLEYAMDLDPIRSDRSTSLDIDKNAAVSLLLERLSRRPDISIFIESSPSPYGPWTPIASSIAGNDFTSALPIAESALPDDQRTAQLPDVSLAPDKRSSFYRLRVTP